MRAALGHLIVQQINGPRGKLPVVTLDHSLERILQKSMETLASSTMAIEPNLANRLLVALEDAHEQRELVGQPTVLLVADGLRDFLARFARPAVRALNVLGFNEVPSDTQIRIVATVGDGAARARAVHRRQAPDDGKPTPRSAGDRFMTLTCPKGSAR